MKQIRTEYPSFIKIPCVLAGIIAVGYLAIFAKELLSPLIFAGLLSILLLPVAAFFEKKTKLPRGSAAALTALLFLFAVIIFFYVLGGQGHTLAKEWPQFKVQLQTSLQQLQTWVSEKFHLDIDEQLVYFNNASSKVLSSGTTVIGSTLVSLSGMLFFIIFAFIYTIFFLRYRSTILQFFISVFRKENTVLVRSIAEQVQNIIRNYIVGLLIEMGAVSTVLCVTFSLLGIHYGILLGLLGGLLNLIPYVGIFITLIISALITFATAGISKVFLVTILMVVIHLLDSNLLFPWVVGSKVRINPMAMIAGVVFGGLVWGIAGMFLSIPILAVLKTIFDKIESLKPWGLLLGSATPPSKHVYAKRQSIPHEKVMSAGTINP